MEEFFEEFKATNMIETANGLKILDLAKYEAELTKYEESGVYSAAELPRRHRWLRINMQPIKSELIKWASRWIDLFTNHLKRHYLRLTGLHEFMGVSKGLDIEVPEGPEGQAALMQVMENIRDVRMASDDEGHVRPAAEDPRGAQGPWRTSPAWTRWRGWHAHAGLPDEALFCGTTWRRRCSARRRTSCRRSCARWTFSRQLEEFYLEIRAFRNDFRRTPPYFLGVSNEV